MYCSHLEQNWNTTLHFVLNAELYRQYRHKVRVAHHCIILALQKKEIYRNKGNTATAFLSNYLGMGYLSQRSYRKTLLFLIGGTVLELTKFVLDKLTDLVDKINDYLKWIDRSISLPEWMGYTVNVLAILRLLLGVVLFFSKKKVIEISFTDKRICVPQKSMSQNEYNMLYQTIKSARSMK